ncbi:hypothetical protein BDR04DRAFT_1123633 [Suillus decipiens]|nr:hypothetical protein BDR04DRAFT_1123633 [Suillus decipiens]
MLVILCFMLLVEFLLLGSSSLFIISMLLFRCWTIVIMECLFKVLSLLMSPLLLLVLSLFFLLMHLQTILSLFLLVQLLLDLLLMQCLLCWWYRIRHIVIKGFIKVLRALVQLIPPFSFLLLFMLAAAIYYVPVQLAAAAHKRLLSHFGPSYGDAQLLAAAGFAAAAIIAMLHGPVSEASHFQCALPQAAAETGH